MAEILVPSVDDVVTCHAYVYDPLPPEAVTEHTDEVEPPLGVEPEPRPFTEFGLKLAVRTADFAVAFIYSDVGPWTFWLLICAYAVAMYVALLVVPGEATTWM